MSEIEKAIKYLKQAREYLATEYIKRGLLDKAIIIEDCFDNSIQALQEKAEREKGCEYCRARKPLLNEMGDLQIDDTDATLRLVCQSSPDDIFEEHTDINYCPMCGRKLVGE